MLNLAVIGKDVSKSQSPAMHSFILNSFGVSCRYERVSLSPESFFESAESLFGRYDAFNVTIPFKAEILPFLKKLSPEAQALGAVNTVIVRTRTGYNTDGFGFLLMLENAGVAVRDKTVLILGAGGAGRSCIYSLCASGAQVFAFERDAERLSAVSRELGGFTPLCKVPVRPFDIIVNCTGIGMHDTVGQTPAVTFEDGAYAPVGERLLSLCSVAVDLIYVPAQSRFLEIAKGLNKKTVNGESMLFYQAYKADCIYTERTPQAEEAKRLFKKFREEQQ